MAFGVWSEKEIQEIIEFAASERITISRGVAAELLTAAEKASIALNGYVSPKKMIMTMKHFDNNPPSKPDFSTIHCEEYRG